MSDILNYRFYLNFVNSNTKIEISEPVKFDGASFTVAQENKRYGRDAYRINESVDLEFYKGNFETTVTPQQMPNGSYYSHLTHGFEHLIESYNTYGFESEVEFSIELEGTLFTMGVLDFAEAETDQLTYFNCSVIAKGKKQLLKRRADVVTDIFSTEDLDGNPITVAPTENILLKAKPVRQKGEWTTSKTFTERLQNFGSPSFFYAFNFIDTTLNNQIENYLSGISGILQIPSSASYSQMSDFVFLEAKNDLTDGFFEVKDINITITRVPGGSSFTPGLNGCRFKVYYLVNDVFDIDLKTEVTNVSLNNEGDSYNYTEGFTITQNITRGQRLWFWFEFDTPWAGSGTPDKAYDLTFNSSAKVEAEYTSTAIDTVIKGVRYIDVIKANVARANGMGVLAEDYDVGGKYYNQFAFTGNLLKQRTDVPFPVKFKDLMNDIKEVNQGYQILDTEVFIGAYPKFYPNHEIGSFLTHPDDSFKSTFNPRYTINAFNFKYKKFEQDRDEEDTIDAIHTETEWLLANTLVENKKDIQINHIRDAFNIESARKLAAKEFTSTDEDDKLFMLDVVNIPPGTTGGFTAVISHFIVNNVNLQLLKSEDMPSWLSLGLAENGLFIIDNTPNAGTYIIDSITDTILTLSGGNPNENQEFFTEISYPYIGVIYTNRTNEDLENSSNLLNADNYSNLRYSIKRNIQPWYSYLAAASLYHPNKVFKNTYFKSNGLATTKFTDEAASIIENANVANTNLGTPLLQPLIYETKLVVNFTDAIAFFNALDVVHTDGSIGGYISCTHTQGNTIQLYIQEAEYSPSKEELTIKGELKY